MFDPNVVQTAEGTKVRPKLARLAFIIGCGGFFAGLLYFMTGSMATTLVPGGLVLWAAIHQLCFPRGVFIPADADEVIVRYGFFLLPTRLVLNRQNVVVDFQVGAKTELPRRGWCRLFRCVGSRVWKRVVLLLVTLRLRLRAGWAVRC